MEMAKTLTIRGFKSIKDQSLDCRRVNVLIGEPNVGKSNILEAIGLFSLGWYAQFGYQARDFCRLERTSNLFYDENVSRTVEVLCNGFRLDIKFTDGSYRGEYTKAGKGVTFFSADQSNVSVAVSVVLRDFRAYRFRVRETFPRPESAYLLPPFGDNLLSVLLANQELRALVNQPFLARGLRIGLRPQENKLEIVKHFEDVIVSYPYSLVSETLQRLTFYQAAIFTNKESIITFEEPEAHAFPFYTKVLAEMIALDENKNQYFISTHNPYFLMPLLAKAPATDVAVHVVYYEDYQTKVKTLSEAEMTELTEIDVFSNLDRFIPGR